MTDQCHLIQNLDRDETVKIENLASEQFQDLAVPFPFPVDSTTYSEEDEQWEEEDAPETPADLEEEKGIQYFDSDDEKLAFGFYNSNGDYDEEDEDEDESDP